MNWTEYFNYEPETGILIWKERPRQHFNTQAGQRRFNTRFVGKEAGCKRWRRGGKPHQKTVNVFNGEKNQWFTAHVIVWEMHNGPKPPDFEIDHVDCDPFNNRLSNLRLSTASQNHANTRLMSTNKSGYKGVSVDASGRWRARITVCGTEVCKTGFDAPEDAHAFYKTLAQKHFGEYARTD